MKIFNRIPAPKLQYNNFDLSHMKVLSYDLGQLIPILLMETVPGDRIKCSSEILTRFAPLVNPVMSRFDVFVHYFKVPFRLLWTSSDDDDDTHKGWEAFITGGEDGTLNPTFPMNSITNSDIVKPGTFWDYAGVPSFTYDDTAMAVNALPIRAYKMIWNEYYRNQNIQSPVDINKTGTVNGHDLYPDYDTQTYPDPLRVNWERDYLTAGLPWVQRGSDVLLPNTINYSTESTFVKSAGGNPQTGNASFNSSSYPGKLLDGSGSASVRVENVSSLEITIADLRLAESMQRWLEANARGGARYKEQILALFGVDSSDSRLDRPEYLSGGKAPVIISEVLATAETGSTTDVGDMAGHGISLGKTNYFDTFVEEFSFIMGLMFVRPKAQYYQGLPRLFWKDSRYDYFFPQFQHLGEQEVFKGEVFFDGTGTMVPAGTFSYVPRYAEYKHINDTVHGDFRTNMMGWHLGRTLNNTAALNSSFVECNPDNRIFSVTTYNTLYSQVYNKINAIRPMEYYGIPRL